MVGIESPTFDHHSDEKSLPFYKCRAEDVGRSGFQDLVCHSFTGGSQCGKPRVFPMARYLVAHAFGESPIKQTCLVSTISTASLSSAPYLAKRLMD
jgi:hypothetical protein